MNDKTTSCYIAYFDILGYRNFLKDPDADEYELFSSIKQEFERLSAVNNDPKIKIEGLRTKSFSDNVVLILDELNDESRVSSFQFLVIFLCTIQFRFLEQHNLLIRGSVVHGDAYIDNSMVFGKGLVDAVEIEEKRSIFPRIVIDGSVDERVEKKSLKMPGIALDKDGEYYIDCFSILDGRQSGDSDFFSLSMIKHGLTARVKQYCRFPANVKDPNLIAARERVIDKHLWMIEKFNECCEKRGQADCRVSYHPVLNDRIMKYELRLD